MELIGSKKAIEKAEEIIENQNPREEYGEKEQFEKAMNSEAGKYADFWIVWSEEENELFGHLEEMINAFNRMKELELPELEAKHK